MSCLLSVRIPCTDGRTGDVLLIHARVGSSSDAIALLTNLKMFVQGETTNADGKSVDATQSLWKNAIISIHPDS